MDTETSRQRAEHRTDLSAALEELHRAAGWPSMRKVSTLLKDRDDLPGAISHEGVRTTLKGLRVPRWETVQSIVTVLAELCDPPRDPRAEVARFLPLWRATREGEAGALRSAREIELGGLGGEDDAWTAEQVAGMLINPFNAIEIHPSLAVPHDPVVTEDEWVRMGVRLIERHGAEFALRLLLHTLKGDYVGAESGSPFGYRDPESEVMEAQAAFHYCCAQICRRLGTEPNILQKSILAMRADTTMDRDDRAEMLENEADPALMREVMTVTPETWDDVSEEAHHMVFGYLVKEVTPVGRLGLPPARRFRITWRVPEPSGR
ncbi:hypothetical protein [Streptomyces murinus]|uniref:Uncharacterized protein n=1 Tax=Streptomyces murinus TaxID=33900 RepID=A0A7W3NMJ5_STRMR|nr:hypothetical protein [Streptomyces murinus]MBA9053226.1 hypothetical protein [Streptomyces murinus]UWW94381.1 hypothetical protein GO605_28725 [Streptomyces murinus]